MQNTDNVAQDDPRQVRIFCDSDVLIAGAASTTGASHILLQLSELTLLSCLTSQYAITEAERNLRAKLPAALPAFRLILQAAVEVTPAPPDAVVQSVADHAHIKDVPILAAAMWEKADFLATFNLRHFRPQQLPPLILQPGKILARIRNAHLERFTVDRLMTIINRFDCRVDVTVTVRPMPGVSSRTAHGSYP